ncbi:Serpentine receptor class gamma-31 [Caenorhabditis elegans]|uniref:Serpentine receptor class gamma-31 n=1 Tax=Caenorhabditis elegans TaxID=6239 RepID=SRG31_CAEEL|nr:Serpentine receptor class gamma-31 [Caenorhabditis elegans]O61892.1 RecName: Full=Serpentine receptor class gamma-31; Short=Protein srg-31 [Caenorhabditis elegans]CCD66560.1 Serpentine receptor class gamma-31 [Caenorhabditis elegans]|eukprot:NP_504758.1 Serpentine receptor class gamma-31 [Caenorhabditis elegans]
MLSSLLITQFIYGTISTIIYSLTVVFLTKNWKHFDNYFLKLYICQFFFNMWMYWNFYITSRLPASTCKDCYLSGWFDSLSKDSGSMFPFKFFIFCQYHLGFMSYSNLFLTSINRFTLIFMPKRYFQIWHYGTYILIALIFITPILFTYPLLVHQAYLEYNPLSDTYVARTQADLPFLYSFILVWMVVTVLLSIIANIICWFKISKYSKAARQQSDYRLFLVSFVTFVINCGVFSIAMLNKISADIDPSKLLLSSRIAQLLSPFANDLLSLSTPYVLIIFSKRIRQSIKNLFIKGTVAPSSITPLQNIPASRI